MGAYIYRLKGKRHYRELEVRGKTEKVYDLVYWYKPYSDFWSDRDPAWMRPIKMLRAKLRKMFRDVEVKYVQIVNSDKTRSDHVFEWNLPQGEICVYDEPDWNGMKAYKL